MFVRAQDIWTPDLDFYSSAAESSAEKRWADARAMVQPSGQVYLVVAHLLDVFCEEESFRQEKDDEGKWRYHCSFSAGSWLHAEESITVADGIDYDTPGTMQANGKWTPRALTARETHQVYECCPDQTYGKVEFTLDFSEV